MRTPKIVTAVALVASTLTAGLISSAAPATAVPGDFEERWCATDPAPCLESATLNGVTVTSAHPDWDVEMTGALKKDGNRYFQWLIADKDLNSAPALQTTDVWELEFDTGTIDPRYTEGYSGVPETMRGTDPDGTFRITYSAKPVLTAFACVPDGGWPTSCPTVATDDETTGDAADDKVRVMLYGEVQDKAGDEDFRGFDVAQNVDEVNCPFLETAPDGSQFLESFMANSHQYDSDPGPAVSGVDFKGQVRWRLPYRMLRNWFGIPNPELMVPASLSGVVRRPDGSAAIADFVFTHEPVANAWVVDVTNIGFSRKILRVKTGTITPTPPTNAFAFRLGHRRGTVNFEDSTARGAKITGYQGRCTANRGDHLVTAGSAAAVSEIDFTGLRKGVGYVCQVRATSKVGPSKWSEKAPMSREIFIG